MPKKTIKVTALIVCVALLALSVPTLNAKPRTEKFDFNNFIKKQVAFVTSLLSLLPFIDQETDKAPDETNDIKEKLKITGDLASGRPSGGD
ncbi:MAG: hypothetical protein WBE11_00130 [Candidatus Aminicenantaceae bacterium]